MLASNSQAPILAFLSLYICHGVRQASRRLAQRPLLLLLPIQVALDALYALVTELRRMDSYMSKESLTGWW